LHENISKYSQQLCVDNSIFIVMSEASEGHLKHLLKFSINCEFLVFNI